MRTTLELSTLGTVSLLLALSAATPTFAQQEGGLESPTLPTAGDITVTGSPPADLSEFEAGPEIEGVISLRRGENIQVNSGAAGRTNLLLSQGTEVRGRGGLLGLGGRSLDAASLVNGLPVKVETVQWGQALVARRISLRNGDLRTATMIRDGTEQGFAEQSAATDALRGRFADIDQYNVRRTVSVYFDSGHWQLSPEAQSELCAAATDAQQINNALLLVVGYTDAVGSEDYNQTLSERRAGRVVNHIQQRCHWAPYRMLTPTGMSESDPTADNTTAQGRAQNRRVSVSILVSKAVEGS
jgi:outer membrane protein OmpA-like peptidoglycan-associated protein